MGLQEVWFAIECRLFVMERWLQKIFNPNTVRAVSVGTRARLYAILVFAFATFEYARLCFQAVGTRMDQLSGAINQRLPDALDPRLPSAISVTVCRRLRLILKVACVVLFVAICFTATGTTVQDFPAKMAAKAAKDTAVTLTAMPTEPLTTNAETLIPPPEGPQEEAAERRDADVRPVDGTDVAEYLNQLVDKHGLSPNVRWFAQRIHARLDAPPSSAAGAGAGATTFPNASHPLDERPSVVNSGDKFLSRGFSHVKAPGLRAIEAAARQERASRLNDFGEPFEGQVDVDDTADIRNRTLTALRPPIKEGAIELSFSDRELGRGASSSKLGARSESSGGGKDDIDASALMFGISTTFARLQNDDFALLDDWARWLTDGRGRSNGAALLLSLHRPRWDQAEVVRGALAARGIAFYLHVDAGDDREGVGGGLEDWDPRPIVPDPAAVRYANLLGLLEEHARIRERDEGGAVRTTVYGLVEDDVFFPNVPRLLAKLREHGGIVANQTAEARDALNEDLWLGLPSDAWSDWVFHNGTTLAAEAAEEEAAYGVIASAPDLPGEFRDPQNAAFLPVTYGGGAVFLAPALARRMAALPCLRRSTADGLDNAIYKAMRAGLRASDGPEPGWDEQLYRCATAYLPGPEVELRIAPSFYAPSDVAHYGGQYRTAQLDPQGFGRLVGRMQQLAGGTQPLALHNYRAWHGVDAGAAHRVTAVCGDDCFLQRFRFRDGWVLVNGYSLTHYAGGVTSVPLERYPNPFDSAAFADLVPPRRMPTPVLAERLRAFQAQRAFWRSQRMVVEPAARPADAQALVWAGKRRTYRLLDTRVVVAGGAPGGGGEGGGETVLQAYVRRRATGLPAIRGAGGESLFNASAGRMAVPDVVRGGLEGDAMDRASEDAAPLDDDEVVVLMWDRETEQERREREQRKTKWARIRGLLFLFVVFWMLRFLLTR